MLSGPESSATDVEATTSRCCYLASGQLLFLFLFLYFFFFLGGGGWGGGLGVRFCACANIFTKSICVRVIRFTTATLLQNIDVKLK